MTLRRWESGLKQCLVKAICMPDPEPARTPGTKLKIFWQLGFFDYLLRRDENFAQKRDHA